MSDSITCPKCRMTSYNQNDVRFGYCGHCHEFTAKVPPENFIVRPVSSEAVENVLRHIKALDKEGTK